MTEKVVWIFITLFSVLISITQFFDFWVMSYGNCKHILAVFSFHNSVFNGIFVIKITYGSHSSTFYTPTDFYLFFFFFSFLSRVWHFLFSSSSSSSFFLLFFSLFGFGSFSSSFLFYSPFLFFSSFFFFSCWFLGLGSLSLSLSLGFHSFFLFSSLSKLSPRLMLLLLFLLSLWVVAVAAAVAFFLGFLEKKNTG